MIDRAVDAALAGHDSLEALISVAVYGKRPRYDDPAWPAETRRIWTEAVRRYHQKYIGMSVPQQYRRPTNIEQRSAITLQDAWAAIEQKSAPNCWWSIPHFGWVEIALFFAIGERAAQYRLQLLQGWRFGGRGKNRRVLRAPCIRCQKPFDAETIVARCCAGCRG